MNKEEENEVETRTMSPIGSSEKNETYLNIDQDSEAFNASTLLAEFAAKGTKKNRQKNNNSLCRVIPD